MAIVIQQTHPSDGKTMRAVSQKYIDEKDPRRLWNWRRQRASALLKSGVNLHTLEDTDDDFVLTFTDMLLRRERITTERDWKRIARRFGGAWDAWSFHRSQSVMTKHLLEAWLLARASDEEIAQAFAMTPSGVRWYEKIYCDIRSRLDKRMYITTSILHPPNSKLSDEEAKQTRQRASDNAHGMVYKLFGYYGGTLAVELVYTGLLASGKPTGVQAANAYINKAISSFLRTRGVSAIKIGELTKFNLPQFIDTASRVASAESSQADMNILASVTEFVGLLNLNDNVKPVTAYKEIKESAQPALSGIAEEMFLGEVEPTAAELAAFGRGEVSENYLKTLERRQLIGN
jgi:hypothetical protein